MRTLRRLTLASSAIGTMYFSPWIPSPHCLFPSSSSSTSQRANDRENPATLSIVIPISPTESIQGVKRTLEYIDAHRGNDDGRLLEVILSMPSHAKSREALAREIRERTAAYETRIVTYDDSDNVGGRGKCQNVGLRAACGTIVLFCHCDAVLPPRYAERVLEAFEDERRRVVMTYFRLKLEPTPSFDSQFPAVSANARCRVFQFPYGDQGLAMRRTEMMTRYEGGFREDLKIMEDFELVKRVRCDVLKSRGEREMRMLDDEIVVSSRRWESLGVTKVTFLNWMFCFLYTWGLMSPNEIYEWYYGSRERRRG